MALMGTLRYSLAHKPTEFAWVCLNMPVSWLSFWIPCLLDDGVSLGEGTLASVPSLSPFVFSIKPGLRAVAFYTMGKLSVAGCIYGLPEMAPECWICARNTLSGISYDPNIPYLNRSLAVFSCSSATSHPAFLAHVH